MNTTEADEFSPGGMYDHEARSQEQEPTVGPTGEFQCERCGRVFTSAHGLSMHMSRSHGIKSKTKNAKRQRRKQRTAPAKVNSKPFDWEKAISLVAGKTVPVKSLARVSAWLAEGEEIHKELERTSR